MKQKKIQQLLYTHYLLAIEYLREVLPDNMVREMGELNVRLGVCNCIKDFTKIDIGNKDWVTKYINPDLVDDPLERQFWFTPPVFEETKNKMLNALEVRAKILGYILQEDLRKDKQKRFSFYK